MADVLTEILRAADKHPNSRVSKLIHLVENEPTQKNIVLLLVELSEHAEYSIDFNISLKYYLDLFQRRGINHDLVLNEAGILLVNSSKIYSKRVDYVQSLVERQILTLSNADDELQKQQLELIQNENTLTAEKPKNRRKRVLEAPSDPYEVELAPKKFKKLTDEKRFALPKVVPKAKSIMRNIEMEPQIHPAGWQCATIYDLENEEDVDTKRNYKLFTYHVEHRYNTLVPDINFRLHFKVKDYMDEQEEMDENEACDTDRSWPPLSEAYVQKYLRLENYVLQQDMKCNERSETNREHILKKKIEQKNYVNVDATEEYQQNLNKTDINESKNVENSKDTEERTLLNTTLDLNTTEENSQRSNVNGENDSGLGQSMLSETNTLDTTQHNSTLESSVTMENLNSNIPEANKSLNATECDAEYDSALSTTVLESSTNTEINTTENKDDLNISTNNESVNDTTLGEVSNSLSVTISQLENDSALDTSVLDETNNTTAKETDCSSLDASEKEEQLKMATVQTNNAESHSTADLTQNPETLQKNICETTSNLDAAVEEGDESQQRVVEGITKAKSNRREDSALADDLQHSTTRGTGKDLKIDAVEQQDKNSTQIRINLPNADDEGVCLSDLEEHDCRLLAPVLKTANILPGVERKDVTIFMDRELREALELRDDIIKHFGRETYKLPVITEAKKPKLAFNILKLPEKQLRRKLLFKLGPEMDLYIQARTFKRSKPEPTTRVTRSSQLLQWYSLNNTDMKGVYMTPPSSPGHCSDFCGFSDSDGDTTSCVEFCGFTEEEQEMLAIKHENRLSQDSGVGVDVNNLTPDKEQTEITFDNRKKDLPENYKKNLNPDDTLSVEGILEDLSPEIRDALSTELSSASDSTTADKNKESTTEVNDKLHENISSSNIISLNDTKDTESSTQNSLTENCSSINIQESRNLLTENNTESQTCTQENRIENSEKLQTAQSENVPKEVDANIEMSCKELCNTENCESSVELLKLKLEFGNAVEQNDNIHDHTGKIEIKNADDDLTLDWSSQGIKTKIQKWHEHLRPILAKSRERHHFDVFQLGTEIIDTVKSKRNPSLCEPLNDVSAHGNLKSFNDVMENRDKSYVSRYFLSTLLLANQSNIEITVQNKSSEKPSSWDNINLKLLSAKRHTVAIEDNIGIIDSKLKAIKEEEKDKSTTRIQNKTIDNQYIKKENDDKEPLIKLQSKIKISKSSLKRSISDITKSACIADKKPKPNSYPPTRRNSRCEDLNNLIQSVQIIMPPFTMPPPTLNTSLMPSTSRQAQTINAASFKVNINAVRTLQPIEKVQSGCDDYDSGIFSIEEMSAS